jgi:hypothetical protein
MIYTGAGWEFDVVGVETTYDDALQAAREVADAEALEIRPRSVYIVTMTEDEVVPTPVGKWLGQLENFGRWARAVSAGERPARDPWAPDGAGTASAKRLIDAGITLGLLARCGDTVEPQTDVATAALSAVSERYGVDLLDSAR